MLVAVCASACTGANTHMASSPRTHLYAIPPPLIFSVTTVAQTNKFRAATVANVNCTGGSKPELD